MNGEIVNKVAQSGIITLSLEQFLEKEDSLSVIEMQDFLFKGLILREKDYREQLKNTDWSIYTGKTVGIINSTDAIIPMWAYMLISNYLSPFATSILMGDKQEMLEKKLIQNIGLINVEEYKDQRVIIKGCGDIPLPASAYVAITEKLSPVVKSLMFGEPCSTVPVYKRPVQKTV